MLLVLALTILAVPVLFSSKTNPASHVKLTVMHLAVVSMLVLIAIQVAWTRCLRFPKHGLHLAVGAWLLLHVISAFISSFPYRSVTELWRVAMLAGGIALGVSALLLHNLVDVSIRWPTTATCFWLFLGLSVAAHEPGSASPREKALEVDDTCIPALRGLADISFFAKDYPRTIDLCNRVLQIDSTSHETRVNLGFAHLLNGEREMAVAEWRRVLREDPGNAKARACLKDLGLKE